jgi:hypothetical protein
MARKQKVYPIPVPSLGDMARVQEFEDSEYPYWPIWRVRLGVECNHLIVCNAAVGAWTHYILRAKRTTPCRKPFGEDCPYCGEVDARFAAYLVVQQTITGKPSILAVPRASCVDHPWLTSRTDLFGYRLTGRKTGNAQRSPVDLKISHERETALQQRACVDWKYLTKVLYNIWGFVSLADQHQKHERGLS